MQDSLNKGLTETAVLQNRHSKDFGAKVEQTKMLALNIWKLFSFADFGGVYWSDGENSILLPFRPVEEAYAPASEGRALAGATGGHEVSAQRN